MSLTLLEKHNEFEERIHYTPSNYNRVGDTSLQTASQVFSTQQEISNRWIYKPAPIFRIVGETKSFSTRKPISIKVIQEEDTFFVENESLRLYGSGSTQVEAMQEFCEHVIYFFEYYKTIPTSKLTGEALELKAVYENLFIEE